MPKTKDSTYHLSSVPDFIEKPPGVSQKSQMFVSGCGSNLTQETNPNLLARPLRQALYSRLNCGPVLERIAHWDPTSGAAILKEVVEPDNTLDHLLDNPREAFERICGSSIDKRKPEYTEEEWSTHIFSHKSVIAKLCAWTTTNPYKRYQEILKILR